MSLPTIVILDKHSDMHAALYVPDLLTGLKMRGYTTLLLECPSDFSLQNMFQHRDYQLKAIQRIYENLEKKLKDSAHLEALLKQYPDLMPDVRHWPGHIVQQALALFYPPNTLKDYVELLSRRDRLALDTTTLHRAININLTISGFDLNKMQYYEGSRKASTPEQRAQFIEWREQAMYKNLFEHPSVTGMIIRTGLAHARVVMAALSASGRGGNVIFALNRAGNEEEWPWFDYYTAGLPVFDVNAQTENDAALASLALLNIVDQHASLHTAVEPKYVPPVLFQQHNESGTKVAAQTAEKISRPQPSRTLSL